MEMISIPRLVVTPREGRVSRNPTVILCPFPVPVTPREGRVSRNDMRQVTAEEWSRHAPRGACE